MNKKTKALTTEQYKEIIQTMREGFSGCRPNERIATALVLEGNLGLRTLVLFPQVGKVELVLLPPLRQILKIHFQFVAHLDCTLCVAGFEGHKLDTPLLVLHLPVNQNRAIYQIDVRPFQTVALIDTQTAIPSQQIRRFCIGAVEIIIQYGKLFPIE